MNVAPCPGARVLGRVSPLTLYALPDVFAWVMVTFIPPVLVTVSDRLAVVPVCTFPNARLAGLGVNDPAVTPTADTGIVSVGFEPSLVIVKFPFTEPLEAGANVTVAVAVWPAARVNGRVNPLRLMPLPETVDWEIVTLVPPVFDIVVASFLFVDT